MGLFDRLLVIPVANENVDNPYPCKSSINASAATFSVFLTGCTDASTIDDYKKGPLPDLQDLIDVAHEHGLYVIVDAAGQIYPLENASTQAPCTRHHSIGRWSTCADCSCLCMMQMSKYVTMGADASCVACKYMGASQSSGMLLGNEGFVHTPHHQKSSISPWFGSMNDIFVPWGRSTRRC